MAELTPLKVVCRLKRSVVLDARWPLMFDGLLAAVAVRRIKGREFDAEDLTAPGAAIIEPVLPLGRTERDGEWWWQASAARLSGTETELEWVHSHIDLERLERQVADPPAIREQVGRYRSVRLPVPASVCGTLEWDCVGDRTEIEEMLAEVRSVGKRRGTGHGSVTAWEITDVTDPHAGHGEWTPHGNPARPMPPTVGWEGTTGIAPLRAPYWLPGAGVEVMTPSSRA